MINYYKVDKIGKKRTGTKTFTIVATVVDNNHGMYSAYALKNSGRYVH